MTENKRFNFGVTIHYKIQDEVKYERRFSDLEGFLEENYDGEHHMLWDNKEECWVHLDEALELMEKEYCSLADENEQLNKELRLYKSDGLETLNNLQRCYENSEKSMKRINALEEENEQLKSTIKEATELLEEEVDLFSNKATEHDIIAYVELKELDNKDAYYMATTTKKVIKMLKELQE